MKLLFDQNLSWRLPAALADIYPSSTHVREQRLSNVDDEIVWAFAKQNGYAIVSKDEDFHQRSFLLGQPPKVIWVRLGNCTTNQIESLLRWNTRRVAEFEADPTAALLILP